MAYKIAVATTDGANVDQHFGSAQSFRIYDVDGLTYSESETRLVPRSENPNDNLNNGCGTSGGGCSASGGGCGTGGGCNSSNSSGCSGGEDSKSVELVADCRCVLSTKVGKKVQRQLDSRAISSFEIDLPVAEALEKIVTYYHKIDNRLYRVRL